MILQVRGTSGSGKTTVMRKVMQILRDWGWNDAPVYVEKRRNPLYYVGKLNGLSVIVLGAYTDYSQCGGCDTIGSARQVAELTARLLNDDPSSTILQEGLLLSEDVKWSSQMSDLRVYYLATPLEQCLRQIEGRRREAGNDKPLNPDNTVRRVGVIERSRVKLSEAGVWTRLCSADQCARLIVERLRKATR